MKLKFSKNKFFKNLVFSLILHCVLVASFYLVKEIKSASFPAPSESLQVELITPETPSTKPAEVTKKSRPMQQQIVDQDASQANEIAPDKTRFLSEKNQVVKKETVAKNNGEFKNRKTPGQVQKGDPLADDKAKTEKSSEKSVSKTNNLESFLPSMNSYEVMKKQVDSSSQKKGEWQARSNNGGDVSKTQDYLKDVNQGLETQLNTKEYKYYGYYSRIRKQLSFHWEPKVREKLSRMFKQGRTIASDTDRITKLLIVLNSSGLLVKVQILSESGVHDLDEAAIEAFRSAAPFPNPPKGIVENDGTVKIRWDFVLET